MVVIFFPFPNSFFNEMVSILVYGMEYMFWGDGLACNVRPFNDECWGGLEYD